MNPISVKLHKESSVYHVEISAQIRLTLSTLLLTSVIPAFKEAFLSAAREALRQLFKRLDDLWLWEKGSGIRVCRFYSRTLKTSIGDISFRYRQAKKNGNHFGPLLEMLGLESYQRVSSELRAWVASVALYVSYRKTQKITDTSLSLFSLWSLVQKEGKMYRDRRKQMLYYYSEGVPTIAASSRDFAIVMLDEIWIRSRRKDDWLKVKTARLAVARFRGEKYIFEPVRVFAAPLKSQATFLKKARQFFDAASGLSLVPHIAVLTDGCPMGRAFCALYNTASRRPQAVWQLDWWHLWQAVHKGCKFERNLESRIWDLLNVEKLDEALSILAAYREAMVSLEKKLKALDDEISGSSSVTVTPRVFWSSNQLVALESLMKYLDRNREGIYGVKRFVGAIPGDYLPFGSGPVERLQAVMIAYRMKKQGKHWSQEGAENLIALLSREWNGPEVEHIMEESLRDLAEWEQSSFSTDDEVEMPPLRQKKRGMDFSPDPISTVFLLRRGKVGSAYRPLQTISEMKLIPRIVSCGERRDAVSRN